MSADAELLALVKEAAGRFLSPFGTARVRFMNARGRGDERARAAQLTTPIKIAMQGQDLPPELVDVAHELIGAETGLAPAEERALLFLMLAVIAALRQGSTRLPLFAPEGRAYVRELLGVLAGDSTEAERIHSAIEELLRERALELVGKSGEYKPLVLEGPNIYLQRMLCQEERFVDSLARRVLGTGGAPPAAELEAALADVSRRRSVDARGAPVELSAEQSAAVARAASSLFTVISGGPGTGKTSVVVAILRVLGRLGVGAEAIALAAPTGKAANRIAESVRSGLQGVAEPDAVDRALLAHAPEAQTLHRLLGYSPSGDRFTHHENNRLSERVVIVDESSMIDIVLMERLVRSVRDDARLILLGDAEQLPSVDAGAMLRDVVASSRAAPGGRSPAVELTQSFRMDPRNEAGRNILSVARKVRSGLTAALFERTGADPEIITARAHVRDLAFSKVEMIELAGTEAAAQRRALLERWYVERIEAATDFDRLTRKVYHLGEDGFEERETRELAALLDCFERARILCVTRSGTLASGAGAINAILHAKAVHGARVVSASARAGGDAFLPGEPVLVERNDYERRLFNGDQGVIARVRRGNGQPEAMAIFRGDAGLTAHPLAEIGGEIALAYAMTVHKAQGSELDEVLLVLPEKDIPLATREVLYTALTRARRSVVIAGERRILERAVERRIRRYSGVSERLERRFGVPAQALTKV